MNLKKIPASDKSVSKCLGKLKNQWYKKCKLTNDFRRNYILFSKKEWQTFYTQHCIYKK